jgi:site-specific recombinase XerC
MALLPAVVPGTSALPGQFPEADLVVTFAFLAREKASATRRAYRSDMGLFSAWCASRGLSALPARPEAVAVFLASQAKCGVKAATISRRVAAIRDAHHVEGLESPTDAEQVKAVVRGIRRTIGIAQAKKAPATAERVIAMVQVAPKTLRGQRDRALLLLGFAGAFRRSELAGSTVGDLEELDEGLRVTLRRSKTDQEEAGRVVPIPRGMVTCPVLAVSAWVEAAGISEGPVFRSLGEGRSGFPKRTQHPQHWADRPAIRRAGGAQPEGVRGALTASGISDLRRSGSKPLPPHGPERTQECRDRACLRS